MGVSYRCLPNAVICCWGYSGWEHNGNEAEVHPELHVSYCSVCANWREGGFYAKLFQIHQCLPYYASIILATFMLLILLALRELVISNLLVPMVLAPGTPRALFFWILQDPWFKLRMAGSWNVTRAALPDFFRIHKYGIFQIVFIFEFTNYAVQCEYCGIYSILFGVYVINSVIFSCEKI